jgi:hypothetical protein
MYLPSSRAWRTSIELRAARHTFKRINPFWFENLKCGAALSRTVPPCNLKMEGYYPNPASSRKKRREGDDFEECYRRQESVQEEARRNAERKEYKRKKKREAQRKAAGAAPPPPPKQTPPPRPSPLFATTDLARASDLILVGAAADTPDAIRRGYLKSALRYHPDKNGAPDAAEQFKKIKAAYERLLSEKN